MIIMESTKKKKNETKQNFLMHFCLVDVKISFSLYLKLALFETLYPRMLIIDRNIVVCERIFTNGRGIQN